MRKIATRISDLACTTFTQKAKHVTLTREALPGESPADVADAVLKAFGRLRRMDFWKASVAGGVAYLHFGGPDGRHAHLHVVLDTPHLDHDCLLKAWEKRLKPPRSKYAAPSGGARVEDARDNEGVLRYVLRAQDADTFDDEDLTGLLAWLHRRHLVLTFGNLRGKRIPEPRAVAARDPASGRRSARRWINAATGEFVAAEDVEWQRSDLAHRIGHGAAPWGQVRRSAALPDDEDGGT